MKSSQQIEFLFSKLFGHEHVVFQMFGKCSCQESGKLELDFARSYISKRFQQFGNVSKVCRKMASLGPALKTKVQFTFMGIAGWTMVADNQA